MSTDGEEGSYDNTALQNKKKLAGKWDISTDSTYLGLTDTQMKTCFAPSAQFFPQIHFLRQFLRAIVKFCPFSPA